MRTADDICLLCDRNKSTKKNSHIVPKFLAKSILGEGSVKRAYLLDTNKGHLPAPYMQDSVKEDFLFCPSCENFFSILETYMAQRLHLRLWDIRKADQFTEHKNDADVTWKVCKEINSGVFRLFLQSIIWRCSVSESVLFNNFKLDSGEENQLKENLKLFIRPSQKELLSSLETDLNKVLALPFIIYTCQSLNSRTSNTLHANPNARNPYALYLSEYILFFSFTSSSVLDKLDLLVNRDLSPIKIGFFNEAFWTEQKNKFLANIVDLTLKKLHATGRKAYTGDK